MNGKPETPMQSWMDSSVHPSTTILEMSISGFSRFSYKASEAKDLLLLAKRPKWPTPTTTNWSQNIFRVKLKKGIIFSKKSIPKKYFRDKSLCKKSLSKISLLKESLWKKYLWTFLFKSNLHYTSKKLWPHCLPRQQTR